MQRKIRFEQKVLKATLLLRLVMGNTYQTKEEQMAESTKWYKDDEATLDDWISGMVEEWRLSPEEREAKREKEFEEFLEREAEWDYKEQQMYRERERDEWDDLWDDRAASVGATWF